MTLAQRVAEDMRHDFPRLMELAEKYDFAERLGRTNDALLAEADRAMYEIWSARTNAPVLPRLIDREGSDT